MFKKHYFPFNSIQRTVKSKILNGKLELVGVEGEL